MRRESTVVRSTLANEWRVSSEPKRRKSSSASGAVDGGTDDDMLVERGEKCGVQGGLVSEGTDAGYGNGAGSWRPVHSIAGLNSRAGREGVIWPAARRETAHAAARLVMHRTIGELLP